MHTINDILTKHLSILALSFVLLAYYAGPVWAQGKEDSEKNGYQLTGGDEGAEGEGGYQFSGGDEEAGDGGYQFTSGGDEGGWQRLVNGNTTSALHGIISQPQQASILGNYPNPFNPETTIRFEVRAAQQLRLSVFNVLGQRVQVLVDGWIETGEHEARFDGYGLPSGTYFTRLKTTAGVVTHRILLAK